MTIYDAFIYSILNYAVEIYANTNNSIIHSLDVLNNSILRIIINKKEHISNYNLHNQCNTLPIHQLHKLKTLQFVHNFVHSNLKLPEFFQTYFVFTKNIHSHSLRNSNNLFLTSPNSNMGKRNLQFKCSNIWNSLETELKSIKSRNKYVKNFKVN